MDRYRGVMMLCLLCLLVAGCGGSGGGGSDDSSSGSGGGSDSGGGSGDSSTDFLVTGTLGSLSVGSISAAKGATSGTVTDIIGVSPTTGDVACKTAEVGSSGTFSMRVTPGRLWYLYFLDRAKKGKQMFLGRLSSSKLDAIVPQKSSATGDFGTVTIDSATGTASSSKEHSEIISSLGIDSGTADTVGAIDDAVRRYSNPDIDEDGTIDCKESKKYMLDFHVRFDMKVSGTRATISDIIDNFLSESATTATYTNTGVYVAYPTSFSSATTGSVTFKDSAVTTDEGGAIPANTATSAVTTNNFSGYYGFGPNISAGSELPSGDIVFSFGGKTLTFADVKTPALSELTAPTGRIFPFIKFTKSDAACTNLCTIAGVGYQWMKKTASGWTAASATEIEVLVASAGGNISLRIDNDSSKSVQITIPKTSVSGTITWTAANATLSGLTSAEFTAITTDRLCHLGLSYDDQIGMRYFEGIDNASGTCS